MEITVKPERTKDTGGQRSKKGQSDSNGPDVTRAIVFKIEGTFDKDSRMKWGGKDMLNSDEGRNNILSWLERSWREPGEASLSAERANELANDVQLPPQGSAVVVGETSSKNEKTWTWQEGKHVRGVRILFDAE